MTFDFGQHLFGSIVINYRRTVIKGKIYLASLYYLKLLLFLLLFAGLIGFAGGLSLKWLAIHGQPYFGIRKHIDTTLTNRSSVFNFGTTVVQPWILLILLCDW